MFVNVLFVRWHDSDALLYDGVNVVQVGLDVEF